LGEWQINKVLGSRHKSLGESKTTFSAAAWATPGLVLAKSGGEISGASAKGPDGRKIG